MAQWTGILYGFYTNRPTIVILDSLKEEALKIGYQFDYYEYQQEKNLLFYKNKKMLEYHLNNGYNTDIEEEGCFGIEVKNVKLHGAATLFEFDGLSNFEPYNINLIFDDIFYYVLVIPDYIENSIFCKKIHQLFSNIIKNTINK